MNRRVAVMTGILVIACASGQSSGTTAMSSAADSRAERSGRSLEMSRPQTSGLTGAIR